MKQGIRPSTTRTWESAGLPPVITVAGAKTVRVSLAILYCYKPRHRTRITFLPPLGRFQLGIVQSHPAHE